MEGSSGVASGQCPSGVKISTLIARLMDWIRVPAMIGKSSDDRDFKKRPQRSTISWVGDPRMAMRPPSVFAGLPIKRARARSSGSSLEPLSLLLCFLHQQLKLQRHISAIRTRRERGERETYVHYSGFNCPYRTDALGFLFPFCIPICRVCFGFGGGRG
jgi:hypothetical protein